MDLNVYGIGNPLIDIICRVSDQDLSELGLDKGIMRLVDDSERTQILEHISGREISFACGGSCPNTLIFLSALGITTALAGKIGNDEYGRLYAENLPEDHLNSQLIFDEGKTGSSIILVSPDSERTMNTYLGVNRNFGPGDVDIGIVAAASYLYFTGYMWDTEPQKQSVLKAIRTLKRNKDDPKVVFDIADPFAAGRNAEEFVQLIHDCVDIVFANREEAQILVKGKDPADSVEALSKISEIAVVKNGAKGSYIKEKGKPSIHIPARNIRAVDTTGAGDMYASGFIFGLCSGMSIRDSGICATYLASRVVEQYGAQFTPAERCRVAEEIHTGRWRFLT